MYEYASGVGVGVCAVESVDFESVLDEPSWCVHFPEAAHLVFAQAGEVAAVLVAVLLDKDVVVWAVALGAEAAVHDLVFLEAVDVEAVQAGVFGEVHQDAVVGVVAVFLAITVQFVDLGGDVVGDEEFDDIDDDHEQDGDDEELFHFVSV